MLVFLDTNFLLMPVKNKIDIFQEIQEKIPGATLCTIDLVVDELKKKKNIASKTALMLLEAKKIKIYKTNEKEADEALLKIAQKKKGIIATNDYLLRKKSRLIKIPVLFLRKKRIICLTTGDLDVL
ncbi:MAG: hypothetical protein QXK00_00825 [archaeon]